MLFTPDDPHPRDRFLAISFGLPHPAWQRDEAPVVHNLQEGFTFPAGRGPPVLIGAAMGKPVLNATAVDPMAASRDA